MIYFSHFGGGAAGDFRVGVQSVASGTSNTTVSGTSTNLTGVTPVAAIILSSRHAIANDNGETAHGEFSIGILQSTNDWCMAYRVEDNSAGSDTDKISSETMVMRTSLATSSTLGRSATGALASGGMDFTFSGTDLVNRRVSYMAFGGADAAAYSVARQYTTTGLSQTTGFGVPDVLFLVSITNNNIAIQSNTGFYSFGIATADGTQMCVIMAEPDAANPSAPVQAILTNRIGGQLSTAGAKDYDLSFSPDVGTGYTITPSATAGSDFYVHLALDLGGRRAKLLAFTTPTSTGNAAITGAGFTPQSAFIVLTNLEATDPSFSISTSDLMSGISFSVIADNAATHSIRSDSGLATTDTASQSRTIALIGPSATDCDAITATLTSFDSDGMTLNYSAVQANAKKGFILFIE